MRSREFALFDAPIGRCALVWGGQGVVGVQLPEATDGATRARVNERFTGAVEAELAGEAQEAAAAVVALLSGDATPIRAVRLDVNGVPPFHARVYALTRTIPAGTTLSYGEVADRLGSPGAARAVGQALARNPFAIVVPCHRVLAAGGRVGGFTANGGVTTKMKLLALEAPSHAPRGAPGVAVTRASLRRGE